MKNINDSFDFGSFFQPAVEREYRPHAGIEEGKGVKLFLNLDLLTVEKMEQIEAEYEKMFEDLTEPRETTLIKVGDCENPAGERDETPALAPLPKISIFKIEKAICTFRARMLGGAPGEDDPKNRLIKDWNVVSGGKKVPVNFDSLMKLSKTQIDHLYNFVTGEASNPTKKN